MKYIFFSLLICAMLPFTNRNVELSGIITDANSGKPVAQATISTLNLTYSTTSAHDGTFRFSVPANVTEIIITAAGYETKNISVKNKRYLNIALNQQPEKEEETTIAPKVTGVIDRLKGRVSGINPSAQNLSRQSNIYSDQLETEYNTEDYDAINENRFLQAIQNPLSTFSIDVDGASYSNVRRFLTNRQLPPAGSVRVEELINYFSYNYPQPANSDPFAINTELSACPWNEKHHLLMIGLQGKKIMTEKLPASNLVFLIDVSGSMMDENKLPLVKSSIKLLVQQLREQDKVSIVVYAGSAGLVLPSTSGTNKQKMMEALNSLEAGGSTAGGEGIKLAYKTASEQFIRGGNNRVILCTDGDFNVGVSSDAELERMIEAEKNSGVFLTVLGYGMGNYKDNKMQKLAGVGNGNHSYIDNIEEAKKVLVNEFGGTLFTIAKDVKLQVEFNPAHVQGYRLVGYENRMLKKEDFNNDKKDAGDMGSGHTVTALYEIIPAGVESDFIEDVDPLKYGKPSLTNKYSADEMMNIKVRYKHPDNDKSKMFEKAIGTAHTLKTSDNFRFAAAVAQYGMLLGHSTFKQNSSFAGARKLAESATGYDREGYRKEFIRLLQKASELVNDESTSRK